MSTIDTILYFGAVAFCAIGVPCLYCFVMWRRTPEYRFLSRAFQLQQDFQRFFTELLERKRNNIRKLRKLADEIQEENLRLILENTPVRELSKFTSGNIRWSTLENNGITTLEALERRLDRLLVIRGIGEKTQETLRDALDDFLLEFRDSAVELPLAFSGEHSHRRQLKLAKLVLLDHFYVQTIRRVPQHFSDTLEPTPPPGFVSYYLLKSRLKKALETAKKHNRVFPDIEEKIEEIQGEEEKFHQLLSDKSQVERRWGQLYFDGGVTGGVKIQEPPCTLVGLPVFQQVPHSLDELDAVPTTPAPTTPLEHWPPESQTLPQPQIPPRNKTAFFNRYAFHPEMDSVFVRTHGFRSEQHFEETFVIPLLERWEISFQSQYRITIPIGREKKTVIVDQVLFHNGEESLVIESKREIKRDSHLQAAMEQAKSYALLLGLHGFVVAAPQGLWLYTLRKREEYLLQKYDIREVASERTNFREELLRFS